MAFQSKKHLQRTAIGHDNTVKQYVVALVEQRVQATVGGSGNRICVDLRPLVLQIGSTKNRLRKAAQNRVQGEVQPLRRQELFLQRAGQRRFASAGAANDHDKRGHGGFRVA